MTDLTLPILVGPTICLDLLQEEDATILFRLVQQNRAYLRQWLPWVDDIQHLADQEVFIQTANQQWERERSLTLGIGYTKQLVGVISLHSFDWHDQTASIGYWLDRAHQGRGIMTQACRALIAVGFQQLDLTRITISCAVDNKKSQAIPLRLGFVWQRTVANREWLYDHYVDHHIYLLKRPTHSSPPR